MSEPMTFRQFRELVEHIDLEHSPARSVFNRAGSARIVKYVDPHFDMRTGHVFSVTFRGYGWEKTFHTQNECRDLEKSLFDRCMDCLDGGEPQ